MMSILAAIPGVISGGSKIIDTIGGLDGLFGGGDPEPLAVSRPSLAVVQRVFRSATSAEMAELERLWKATSFKGPDPAFPRGAAQGGADFRTFSHQIGGGNDGKMSSREGQAMARYWAALVAKYAGGGNIMAPYHPPAAPSTPAPAPDPVADPTPKATSSGNWWDDVDVRVDFPGGSVGTGGAGGYPYAQVGKPPINWPLYIALAFAGFLALRRG
jgi:hypothetical protein